MKRIICFLVSFFLVFIGFGPVCAQLPARVVSALDRSLVEGSCRAVKLAPRVTFLPLPKIAVSVPRNMSVSGLLEIIERPKVVVSSSLDVYNYVYHVEHSSKDAEILLYNVVPAFNLFTGNTWSNLAQKNISIDHYRSSIACAKDKYTDAKVLVSKEDYEAWGEILANVTNLGIYGEKDDAISFLELATKTPTSFIPYSDVIIGRALLNLGAYDEFSQLVKLRTSKDGLLKGTWWTGLEEYAISEDLPVSFPSNIVDVPVAQNNNIVNSISRSSELNKRFLDFSSQTTAEFLSLKKKGIGSVENGVETIAPKVGNSQGINNLGIDAKTIQTLIGHIKEVPEHIVPISENFTRYGRAFSLKDITFLQFLKDDSQVLQVLEENGIVDTNFANMVRTTSWTYNSEKNIPTILKEALSKDPIYEEMLRKAQFLVSKDNFLATKLHGYTNWERILNEPAVTTKDVANPYDFKKTKTMLRYQVEESIAAEGSDIYNFTRINNGRGTGKELGGVKDKTITDSEATKQIHIKEVEHVNANNKGNYKISSEIDGATLGSNAASSFGDKLAQATMTETRAKAVAEALKRRGIVDPKQIEGINFRATRDEFFTTENALRRNPHIHIEIRVNISNEYKGQVNFTEAIVGLNELDVIPAFSGITSRNQSVWNISSSDAEAFLNLVINEIRRIK